MNGVHDMGVSRAWARCSTRRTSLSFMLPGNDGAFRVLGWHIAQAGTHRTVARTFSLAAGCVSTALGLLWGYPLLHRLL
jgi:hypothetical protein